MPSNFVRVADVPTAAFGDELAVMNLRSGAYIAFNRTAADVWNLLDAPQPLDALVETLTARYSVAQEQCRAELETLLASLVEMGVVERRDG